MKILEELKLRNLLFDQNDPNLEDVLEKEKVTFYLGADPTGPSLHVGHLVTFLVAKRLEMLGHKPVILIGGATGLIGDPKMQGERKMLTLDITLSNAKSLENQINNIFNFKDVVNNYDWISKINVIEFLRDYGKCFNVNNMINKETVKARLETGISYTEFSYQILQSLDWLHLYENYNCKMQIGGQDQWGNMTAGSDLIRKKLGSEANAYTFTIPLILKSDGTKFGKSEGGKSVWLDKEMTSPYEFYQFWINTPDNEVELRLKQFTFLSLEEIKEVIAKWEVKKEERLAQKVLAKEITTFVHGKDLTEEAIKISEALFSGNYKELTAKEIKMGFSDLVHVNGLNKNLIDVLIEATLASSKREARDFISSGAVTLNGEKCQDLAKILTKDDAIDGSVIVLRRGKKKYALVEM